MSGKTGIFNLKHYTVYILLKYHMVLSNIHNFYKLVKINGILKL
jgi:hypothetical protein